MKRFHVHLHVDDLARSIVFYHQLFAAEPTRVENDYAKWMLDDPPVNFAISTRGSLPGIDHLGIQTDNAADLAALKARAEAADLALLDEGATTCCHARSEKHWITDPQGIAWEHFHTLGSIPVFREGEAAAGACCTPGAASLAAPAAMPASAHTCCAPDSPAPTARVGTDAPACCPPTSRGKPIGIAVNGAESASSCC
jgi:hypothetical protein